MISALMLAACKASPQPDFTHNLPRFEKNLVASIESNGPGDRFVIKRSHVSDQVVDRYTISLTRGKPYSAVSESGSAVIGLGSVVQFCGWGEYNGKTIYTESAYLCKRGEGLVFGVTRYGWVHLYGSGEIAGKRLAISKP